MNTKELPKPVKINKLVIRDLETPGTASGGASSALTAAALKATSLQKFTLKPSLNIGAVAMW